MQEAYEWFAMFWPVILAGLAFAIVLGRAFERVHNVEETNKAQTLRIAKLESDFETRASKTDSNLKAIASKLESDFKKSLFHGDGTLIYVCRKDCDKEMEDMDSNTKECMSTLENSVKDNKKEYMTKNDHESRCKIASLEMKEIVSKLLDTKFEIFERNLFKQLRHSSNMHSEV